MMSNGINDILNAMKKRFVGVLTVFALGACSPMAGNTGGAGSQPFIKSDSWSLNATRADKTATYQFQFQVVDARPDHDAYWQADFKTNRSEFSGLLTDGSILYVLGGGMTYLFTPVSRGSEEMIYCGFLGIKTSDTHLKGVTYMVKNKADIKNVNPAFYFSLIQNDRTKYPVGDCEIQKQ